MPDSAGAHGAANDATVSVVANDPADVERRLKRLRADVVMSQRVLDELVAGQELTDAKAAQVAKLYEAKQREVKKMVTAARRAVKDAEAALKAEEG